MGLELYAALARKLTAMIPERESILEGFGMEEHNYNPNKDNRESLVKLLL
jgi:hypothetical protein